MHIYNDCGTRQLVERLNQGWHRESCWFRTILIFKVLILVLFTVVISTPSWLTCTAIDGEEEGEGAGSGSGVKVTVGLWGCVAESEDSGGSLGKNDSICQQLSLSGVRVYSQALTGIGYVVISCSCLLDVSRIYGAGSPDSLTKIVLCVSAFGGLLGFIGSVLVMNLKKELERMPGVEKADVDWGCVMNLIVQIYILLLAVFSLVPLCDQDHPQQDPSPSGAGVDGDGDGGGGDGGCGGGDGTPSSEDEPLSSEDGLHEPPPSYEDVVDQLPSYETAVMQLSSAQAGDNPSSPPEVNGEQPPAYEAAGDQLSPLEASGDQSSLPEASGDQHSSPQTSSNQTPAGFGGDQMSPSESDGNQTTSSEVSDGKESSTGAGADQQLSSESSVDQTSHSEALSGDQRVTSL